MPPEVFAATKDTFSALIPLKRLATLDELASGYLFLMQNTFITGQELAIDGGIMLAM